MSDGTEPGVEGIRPVRCARTMTVPDIVREGDSVFYVVRLEFAPSATEVGRRPSGLP